jgi:hypothetical protein
MQQRRLRLGDILDDYCPRERRITNHVIVAMIEDDVRQTRCSTCDAEHEYKQGKAPALRRKKAAVLAADGIEDARPRAVAASSGAPGTEPLADDSSDDIHTAQGSATEVDAATGDAAPDGDSDRASDDDARGDDDGPVHRRLIRATLPRPEGHVPERKEPEFTMRQSGRETNGNRQGQRSRGHGTRQPEGQFGGQNRFGGQRQGAGSSRQGSGSGPGQAPGHRQGNRPGQPSSNRSGGGRPGGQNRGPGRKRGR